MPINCDGYIVTESNEWRQKGNGQAKIKDVSSNHAERVAWGKLPKSTAYLLVQNAYPCADCHNYFKGQSLNNHSIIIKVEANEGAYSSDHFNDVRGRPILNGSIPCIIYYHKGNAHYVTITDVMAGGSGDPPNGFPNIPDIL